MNYKIQKIKGGITAPRGFAASGIASRVKKNKLDLGLIYSKTKAVCAGFFTTNKVKAAPVLLCSTIINKPVHKAVIINSGCANCLTGEKGILDAKLITKRLARLLKAKDTEVLMCSTGVIGKRLDVKKIIPALPDLIKALSVRGANEMAKAIMTTDTYSKQAAGAFKVGKKEVRIGGVAKGAGMIAPNMVYPERSQGATMICVIATDADISKTVLRAAAKQALDNSFNCITVDGDMSTNDAFLCFANGASGVKIKPNSAAYKKFTETLCFVALSLAKMIVKDGEGATKFIEVYVTAAESAAQAKRIAFGIANSNLVKTAVYGSDPNIGRIAAACGASDSGVKQDRLDVYLNGKKAIKNGIAYHSEGLKNIFKKKEIKIVCDLNLGKYSHRVFTSDLSPEYVRINAEYT